MTAEYSSEIKIAQYQVIKSFYTPTNPEILVKISPLDFKILVIESRPLKIKNA